jgi:histidyl-tRNA synthetase
MPEYRAPRGASDLLPQDQPYWRFLKDTARRVAESYGYGEIDTPVFEHAGVFIRPAAEGTDLVDKEVYRFQDRGGDDSGRHGLGSTRLPGTRHEQPASAGASLLHLGLLSL